MHSSQEPSEAVGLVLEEDRIKRLIQRILLVKKESEQYGFLLKEKPNKKEDKEHIESLRNLLILAELLPVEENQLYQSIKEALLFFQKKYKDYLNLLVCSGGIETGDENTVVSDYQEQFKIFLQLFVPYCGDNFNWNEAIPSGKNGCKINQLNL